MICFRLQRFFYILQSIYSARHYENADSNNVEEYEDMNNLIGDDKFFSSLHEFLEEELHSSGIYYDNNIECSYTLLSFEHPLLGSSRENLAKSNCFSMEPQLDERDLVLHKAEDNHSKTYTCNKTPCYSDKSHIQSYPNHSKCNQLTQVLVPPCHIDSNNESLDYIQKLLISILYYRYSVNHFFKNYYKRKKTKHDLSFKSTDDQELFIFITKSCFEFSKLCYDTKYEYKDSTSVDFIHKTKYKKLHVYENRLLEEIKKCGKINCETFSIELCSIRNFNKLRILKISQITSNTILSSFYSTIRAYFGDCVILEAQTEMLISFLKSLYELSLFYTEHVSERQQESFKLFFLDSHYCMKHQLDTSLPFLFLWAFNWIYYFVYYNTITSYTKELYYKGVTNILINEFSVQSIILIYLLYNCNDEKKSFKENIYFYNKWKINIVSMFMKTDNITKKSVIHNLILFLLDEIACIYHPIIINNAKPEYLRILPLPHENITSLTKLIPITKKYLIKILKLAEESYLRTINQQGNSIE